ncbi:uncharacterized protein MKK02DRAFT_20909 [Dioszegia hungarica]|uniref:Band 7 domain-containing protein n=1 Tax=Dioszegia hungarica TaxID=4972 RepID=A0AA38H3N7_9TREE|nr:uncharacterized protein MKK02DRAFT_20909 [Dioszegia hungarica]KAI9632096.1 hypothetical protein MKK02DRAFT_20909 [Dioszegia hungarica]
MSAPNYQASNDDTIVPNKSGFAATNDGHGSGSGSNDDDLHRYVTDDVPRKAKMGIADGAGAPPRQARGDGILIVQPLKKNDMQPSYAQDLGSNTIEHGVYGTMMNSLGACIGAIGAIPCCPLPSPFRSVQQGSVGLISRFGQFYKSVDPGLVQVNVCSEEIKIVDVKIQLSPVPRQTVQTKDNVSVDVDSVICWHVISPYRAAFGINDVRLALVERAQTTLRQVVGGRVLQSVISDREGLAQEVAEIIEATAEKWGVAIESILLKDINFSIELQQSLSSAATQKRIGESKVIAARAEVDAAKLMRQAADILASPAAMQIRQLDALQNMSRSAASKVIFVPMNLGTMGGSSGLDPVMNQIAADGNHAEGSSSGYQGNNMALNAGMISSMSQL